MRNPLIFLSGLLLLATPACDSGSGDEGGSTSTNPTADMTEPTPTTGGGGAELTCDDYCTTITANCTAANAQYFDNMDGGMASCMAACNGFPEGTLADTANNTLGCRIYHAGVAGTDAAMATTHCPHAGPGGAGACGSNCEGFCSVAMSSCGSVYATMEACMTECATFDDSVRYDISQTGGNTLACRLYHLTAGAIVPDPHCTHINAASPTCQ